MEGGKLKCHRYWPEASDGTLTLGLISVTSNFQEIKPNYVQRSFTITKAGSDESREVQQFSYTAWPDHGVPNTTKELLQFRYERERRRRRRRRRRRSKEREHGSHRTPHPIPLLSSKKKKN